MSREDVNPCKCGSKRKPHLDSDDMIPCWAVECFDCKQFQHAESWSMNGAIYVWNENNPKTPEN
jgi:hypothetical protein